MTGELTSSLVFQWYYKYVVSYINGFSEEGKLVNLRRTLMIQVENQQIQITHRCTMELIKMIKKFEIKKGAFNVGAQLH